MTQPAVDGPVQHTGEPAHPDRPLPLPPEMKPVRRPGHAGTPWRKAAVIAAAGIPLGLLWWLLAPSGLNLLTRNPDLATGTNTATWLPRDLVLAGLCLLAGCIAGSFVAGSKHAQPAPGTVVLVVLAGAAGSLLAWGTGLLSAQWWGAAADTSASASVAFSLRSYAVLAIWPAAIALAIFLNSLFPGSGGKARS
ncbi:hypothetical protein SAMN04487914_12546 [Arthrobacter sp. ok909]|uniref:hypothetical protein n=1 Tax=Arthrobacter sp. ok909 TaxID=1761746 RepID=UPI00088464AB|nr:hypothetical protein [Arthrobacter sp. ok909]SDP67290.1 hypothetical protein SAMN04487914_12546 [Arthrobacter sp. ok909]